MLVHLQMKDHAGPLSKALISLGALKKCKTQRANFHWWINKVNLLPNKGESRRGWNRHTLYKSVDLQKHDGSLLTLEVTGVPAFRY